MLLVLHWTPRPLNQQQLNFHRPPAHEQLEVRSPAQIQISARVAERKHSQKKRRHLHKKVPVGDKGDNSRENTIMNTIMMTIVEKSAKFYIVLFAL